MSKTPDIKAYHEEEERYSRLVLEYFSTKERKQICDKIAEAIEKFDMVPYTIVTPKDSKSGEYCLEFHDDYDRKSGDFFEYILKSLNIKECEA